MSKVRHKEYQHGDSGYLSGFFTGCPYKKDIKNKKQGNKPKKYKTKFGWLTTSEICELAGINERKFYRLVKYKTVEQIIKVES